MKQTSLSPKDLITGAFREVIENTSFNLASVNKYFSPQYVQNVDGKTLHFAEFVDHLKKQKESLSSAKVKFLALVSEGPIVFTNHEVSVIRKDGKQARFKILAQFTIADSKIVSCDELTKMIEGSAEDRDLGSRH